MNIDFDINLQDFTYVLPDDRIASFGLPSRDQSKLLTYSNQEISDRQFNEIDTIIPAGSTLFFNNTKVIQARLQFFRATGAAIEIFLLNPAEKIDISKSLSSTSAAKWACMIGNLKRWKDDEVLNMGLQLGGISITLNAKLTNRKDRTVEFFWQGSQQASFGQIIDAIGSTPLPPYIKRPATPDDKARYQTVYSEFEGAVAAPTAGLHFTPELMQRLADKGVREEYVTLHVSSGTFQPIQTEYISDHPMHNERIHISAETIAAIIESEYIIPVGTTSMRTLESLYWFGHKLSNNEQAEFKIEKLYPYANAKSKLSRQEAMNAVQNYMENNKISHLSGETEIFIFPGYSFHVCQGLITNFHQPGSTLILLVAAFIGKNWKKIYQHALKKGYRFLSYGDSSILLP